jgi:hypothetical protein
LTALAATTGFGPTVAPPPRAAPQAATDRFAFAAVLDSLPGADAKAGSSVAEGRSRIANEPRQGDQPSGQPDGHPMPGDGPFLSTLPFALPPSLAANVGREDAVDPLSIKPPSMGTRLENNGGSNVVTAELAKPAIARLTGERTFHFAASTSGGSLLTTGQVQTDPVSFAPQAGLVESVSGAIRPSALGPLSVQGRDLRQDAAAATAGAEGASLSSAEAIPAAGAAPSGEAQAPVAPRGAGASVSRSLNQVRSTAQDPARGGRKSEAGLTSPARLASPAAPPAKAEPTDKADGPPPDPIAPAGQPAAQGGAFGAQPWTSAAAASSFGPHDAPTAAADIAPRASPPAGQTPATSPVKEIDLDLSPSGLENVSMTMRLAGEKLSVVIRAASSQTIGSIEGARDAIADRLAAIGQPLDSLVVKQMGLNTDGNAKGNGSSADSGSAGGEQRTSQGPGERGGSNDALSRRGAGRDRSF